MSWHLALSMKWAVDESSKDELTVNESGKDELTVDESAIDE